jgi:serine-type D-Ala-D-Ala carboxypeptidase/endopeptidase (penicillin-binding protein 4)
MFMVLKRIIASAACVLALEAAAQGLPADIQRIFARAGVALNDVSLLVVPAGGGAALAEHLVSEPRNPASVMKLVTTAAALDTLGSQHVWKTVMTPLGPIRDGVLEGNLWVRGGGDPKLVIERLEPMMRQLRAAGIERIAGDIVIDRSAFRVPEVDPNAFDGEGHRPYNTRPDAMLVNFKAVVLRLIPNPAAQVAQVVVEPPLLNYRAPATVPLLGAATGARGACVDWKSKLRADFTDPNALSLAGGLPAQCGMQEWAMAYPEPQTHSARALAAMWAQVGGTLNGKARDATPDELRARALAPAGALRIVHDSLSAAEIVRDVNKFSNNLMAQHVFLALGPGTARSGVSSYERSRSVLSGWWQRHFAQHLAPTVDNGSGLSRTERVSAAGLGALLAHMAAHKEAAAFFDSLPIAGVDGTLRNFNGAHATGRARLKTGSLRDASALAGYIDAASGQRYVFVGLYNGPQAGPGASGAARAALERAVDWVAAR